MSAAQDAMNTLNAQWYNAVITGCGLDSSTFQLMQGNQPVYSTSELLWDIFDAVPPQSVNHYYNPSQLNDFSVDYGGVINNLKPQNSEGFVNAMGDYYPQWTSYLKTGPTIPAGGILALFQNWAALNMPDPNQAQAAYTAYQSVSQGVVPVAVALWLSAGGGTGGTKAYNNTISNLTGKILSAPPKSVHMDSTTESSDVSHTWANGEIQGGYDIFWGNANASWDRLTVQVASAGITIDATFQHLMVFAAAPLAHSSNDPILSQYNPWYSSSALNLAFQHNDNVVWNNTPPTWTDTFGPNGNMLRTCTALVIVDGITIKMQSSAKIAFSDQQTFQSAAEGGVWPFFVADASGGWKNDVQFSDEGNFTVTSTMPEGNPQILGTMVTPIQTALAQQLSDAATRAAQDALEHNTSLAAA